MPREQQAAILDPLRRLINRQTGSALTDAQLLEDFVSRRDEASFEVLVWRHGAMVLALCKRVLRDAHEAEDAFQATFLVFARKASSIGRGEVLAAWLYKVAYRITIRLRAAAAKRSASGEPTDAIPAPEVADGTDWNDLKPVLDDEISRLPEKYRAPFILCYLEGRTNEEAAEQLGCPKGTVLSRLSRGRERLRDRLTRRGVAITAVALASALSQNAASAGVPAALVSPTVGAAIPFAAGTAAAKLVPASVAALTEGTLQAMTLIKLKVAAALVLAVLGTGLAWAARGDGDRASPAVPVAAAIPTPLPSLPQVPVATPFEEEQNRDVRPTTAPALTGRVTEVAQDGKSFTVETPPAERGGEPGKATVKLGEKAAVTYNGVGLDGAAPTVGYQAVVWFAENSKDTAAVVNFSAMYTYGRGADVGGKVTDVADGKSITLELTSRPMRGEEPKKVTIPFDAKTVVAFSNVGKGGAKAAAGQTAMVSYADDGKTAGKVQLYGSADQARRDEKYPDLKGRVMRADGDSKFVLEVPSANRAGEVTKVTITAGEKATLVFNNVLADGAKAEPGMQAMVWLADKSKDTASKVHFFGNAPERWTVVNGKVVAVAKDGKSFTLEALATTRGEEAKRTELKITDKSKMAFFGVEAGGAKIAEGMFVQARLADDSKDTVKEAMLTKAFGRGR